MTHQNLVQPWTQLLSRCHWRRGQDYPLWVRLVTWSTELVEFVHEDLTLSKVTQT